MGSASQLCGHLRKTTRQEAACWSQRPGDDWWGAPDRTCECAQWRWPFTRAAKQTSTRLGGEMKRTNIEFSKSFEKILFIRLSNRTGIIWNETDEQEYLYEPIKRQVSDLARGSSHLGWTNIQQLLGMYEKTKILEWVVVFQKYLVKSANIGT